MRRPLGSLALLLLLAAGASACGDDEGRSGDDPSSTARSSPTVTARTVRIVSATAAGGRVSSLAVPLPDAAAVHRFGAQFTQPALTRKIVATVEATDVPDGQALVGAVVAVGCDVPSRVTVAATDDGVVITAVEATSPVPECFASVTSVALVLVDADQV